MARVMFVADDRMRPAVLEFVERDGDLLLYQDG